MVKISKRLRHATETLSEVLPLTAPVKITRPKNMDEWGSCEKLESPDRFIIRIHQRLSDDWAVSILAHEWAHARAWTDDPTIPNHGPEWGIAYSRCYSALFDA